MTGIPNRPMLVCMQSCHPWYRAAKHVEEQNPSLIQELVDKNRHLSVSAVDDDLVLPFTLLGWRKVICDGTGQMVALAFPVPEQSIDSINDYVAFPLMESCPRSWPPDWTDS